MKIVITSNPDRKPMLVSIPAWVLYEMEGYRRPVARVFSARDVIVACYRYVRQGRSRELASIVKRKIYAR